MMMQERPAAIARIRGSHIAGTVKFWQKPKGVLVVASIQGLPSSTTGIFAFHIHEGNLCQGEKFSATGSHYNPEGNFHPNHAGDLPPLLSCGGSAYLALLTDRFTLKEILGRTIVIHSEPDDFHSQPAGNAGHKIACGIICPM